MANIISILIDANDKASKKMEQVSSKFEKTTAASKKVALGVAAIGTASAAGLAYAGKQALDFETRMGNISTLIEGDSKTAFDTLGVSILDMTKKIPKSADDLGASAYDILSAGITDSAEAMEVLENSGKLATAGLSETSEATNIMTSALNAFQIPASDSAKVSDILFKTVKNGKTTVSEMAQAFGASAPIVASAKISLEEFSAATAALTTTGLPASQAQNQLRAAVIALQKPTDEMSKILQQAGYESGAAALEQDGLVKVMQNVKKEAGGNVEALGKAYGSVEALGAATSLTGNQAEAFNATLKDMEGGANAVESAFQKQSKTAGSALSLLKNNVNAAAISLGSKFLPAIASFSTLLIEKGLPALEKMLNFLKENQIIIAIVGGAIIAALVPAFISWAVAAGSAAVATLAALAPILLIGAAVGALAFLIIKNWNWIKETTTAVFGAIFGWIGDKINWLKNNWASAIGFIIGFFATLPIKLPILMVRAVIGVINAIRGVDWGAVWNTVKNAFGGAVDRMWTAMKGLWNKITGLDWGQIFKNAAKGVGNSIIGLLEGAINGALSGLPGDLKVKIPRFEKGVRNFGGGLAVVGDVNGRGGELLNLPRGTDVYSNRESKQIVGGMNSGGDKHFTFNVKAYSQFDLRQAMREAGYLLAR